MDIKHKKNDGSKQQKRRGYAYVPRSQKITTSQDTRLKQGFVMKNRPGIASASDNVVEMYFDKKPTSLDKNNYMFLGRGGTGENLNAGYVEISSQKDLTKDPNIANGSVGIGLVDRDAPREDWVSQITVRDARYFGLTEGNVVMLTGDGADGLVVLGVVKNGYQSLSIQIDTEGIYLSLADLPTSDPGVPGQLWRNGTVLNISV